MKNQSFKLVIAIEKKVKCIESAELAISQVALICRKAYTISDEI